MTGEKTATPNQKGKWMKEEEEEEERQKLRQEVAQRKQVVRHAMQIPFGGKNLLRCALDVSSSFADSWYEAK